MQPMAHGPRAELALAQIGARIRRDLEPFQKLTKLTALIIPAPTAPGALQAVPPPPGGGGSPLFAPGEFHGPARHPARVDGRCA